MTATMRAMRTAQTNRARGTNVSGWILPSHGRSAGLEREVAFCPATDLADRYGVPDHLRRFPCLHVRLHWRDPQGRPVQVPGPVCFGSGRFYGLGLFAAF